MTVELKVFVASPGGLGEERDIVGQTAAILNANIGEVLSVRVIVRRYEQMVGRAGIPQAQINAWVDDCDLLVAPVHRRWGSPTGNGYESGFEEEFDRARKRRQRSSRPEIALFFKQVDPSNLADPGPQLARVLAFRKSVEENHEAFYSEFSTPDQFRALVQQLLVEEMHKASRGDGTNDGHSPSREDSGITQQPGSPTGGSGDLATVFERFARFMSGVGADGPLDFDRLELFALSASRDDELIPTHLAHRLYRRRGELHFMQVEAVAWFRTYLEDLGRASGPTERVIPFPSTFGGLEVVQPLILESAVDSITSESVQQRNGFLYLASALEIRPDGLWPKGRLDADDVDGFVKNWTQSSDSATIDAAITYWMRVAKPSDRRLAKALSETDDPSTAKMGRALVGLLKAKPDATELATLSPRILLHDAIRARFPSGDPLATLQESNLVELARYSYGDQYARLAALEELIRRNVVPLPVITEVIDGSAFDSIGESSWLRAAREMLLDRQMSPRVFGDVVQVAKELDNKNRSNAILARVASSNGGSTQALGDAPSWSTADTLTADQVAVLLEAGSDTDEWLDVARQFAEGRLPQAIAFNEALRNAGSDESLVEFVTDRYTISALRYLVRRKGNQLDNRYITILRDFATSDRVLASEAAKLLWRVFSDRDIDFLLTQMRYDDDNDRVAHRKAVVERATLKRLNKLLQSDEPELAGTALRELHRRSRTPPRRTLQLFLRNDDPNLRMAALDVLTDGLELGELERLLDEYADSTKQYYYNVVCEMDRRLGNMPVISGLRR